MESTLSQPRGRLLQLEYFHAFCARKREEHQVILEVDLKVFGDKPDGMGETWLDFARELHTKDIVQCIYHSTFTVYKLRLPPPVKVLHIATEGG